jgi:hypothetical protein
MWQPVKDSISSNSVGERVGKSPMAELLEDVIGTHALRHLETEGMKIHSPELSLARLAVDL